MGRKRSFQQGVLLLLVFLLVAPFLEFLHFHEKVESASPSTLISTEAGDKTARISAGTSAALRDADDLLKKKSPLMSHEEDCHCPLHRTNCGHTTTYLIRDSYSFESTSILETVLIVRDDRVHQGPFLEGPFQPPRAV